MKSATVCSTALLHVLCCIGVMVRLLYHPGRSLCCASLVLFSLHRAAAALKELKTCRARYTMQADSISKNTAKKEFTPYKIDSFLDTKLYPAAISTTCPFGGCTFPSKNRFVNVDHTNRRDIFRTIFNDEQVSINLNIEKLCFEGHFVLSVAYSADAMTSIDAMANFALHGVSRNTEIVSRGADAATTDGDDNERIPWPVPLTEFNVPIANYVFDTRNDPGEKNAELRLAPNSQRQVSPGLCFAHVV